jgi:hypothetical protein
MNRFRYGSGLKRIRTLPKISNKKYAGSSYVGMDVYVRTGMHQECTVTVRYRYLFSRMLSQKFSYRHHQSEGGVEPHTAVLHQLQVIISTQPSLFCYHLPFFILIGQLVKICFSTLTSRFFYNKKRGETNFRGKILT